MIFGLVVRLLASATAYSTARSDDTDPSSEITPSQQNYKLNSCQRLKDKG
jgi:hypothetical protein